MTRLLLSLLTVITFSAAHSQRQYFIYLQSEPEQPFFVKLNERVHSSSTSGYLILSKLHDSTYTFTVGFPQNKWPEHKFTIEVKAKDHGYLLKNFGEKGWGLFDLQTLSVQMGQSAGKPTSSKTEQKDVSPFTAILAKAANDPSLKERPVMVQPAVSKSDNKPVVEQAVVKKEDPPVVVKKEESPVVKREEPPVVKKEEQSVAKKEDTPAVKKEEPIAKKDDPPVTKDTSVAKKTEVKSIPAEEYKRSVITKKSGSSTTEGLSFTYIDEYGNGKKDTIRIIIPQQKPNTPEINGSSREDKKFLDISANDTAQQNDTTLKSPSSETLAVVATPKKKCTSSATESDFLKLRKKMAAEKGDDNMVDEARKYFKTKCFAVTQLKNLSALFLDDGGKYKFFDASYSYVSDPENFSSLVAEIKDEYYINRFKAMVR